MKHKKSLSDHFASNPWGIKSQIFDVGFHCDNIIGIDAGGTKTLVAHIDKAAMSRAINRLEGLSGITNKNYYEGAAYNSIDQIISDYIHRNNIDPKETCVCIAGAGPVQNNSIQMTNRPWSIYADDILNRFQFKQVYLINDLEAVVYAVDSIESDHLVILNRGRKVQYGNVAVIAAGTGLGESIGVCTPQKNARIAIATEGGNCDFAPADELEVDFWKYLKSKKNHVSWEDALSGGGLRNLYEFLLQTGMAGSQETSNEMAEKNPAEVITSRGLSNQDPVCRRTLEMFAAIYGGEAGNLALKSLPYGGLYITGGIAPRLVSLMREDVFMKRFLAKGRLMPVLESIPVYLVTNPDYGVIGAINFAIINMTL